MSVRTPEEVLQFWLGDVDGGGRSSSETIARWWKKSDEFDAEVREKFQGTLAAISRGECDSWLETDRGRAAYVIVLDQLSRNMFRNSAAMYAEDARSLAAVRDGLEAGVDRELGYHARYFFYMPLMHAEELEAQDLCVEMFEAMKADYPAHAEGLEGARTFAVKHRDIVARFGHFPHRNEILGRESSAEELEFLEGPGSSF